jgi:hypothetical protein
MIDILDKYLQKIGVKSYDELLPEEKNTYKEWEESLSGKKITDDTVALFLVNLENDIIDELIKPELTKDRDTFLKMQLDLIRKIKTFLRTPELEKKMTEYQLMNLIK